MRCKRSEAREHILRAQGQCIGEGVTGKSCPPEGIPVCVGVGGCLFSSPESYNGSEQAVRAVEGTKTQVVGQGDTLGCPEPSPEQRAR